MWLVNFYGFLSWLQPLLVGEFYIREIPWWVAALTHIAFTLAVLLAQPLGEFKPESYRPPSATPGKGERAEA